jgi:hypothetical protein
MGPTAMTALLNAGPENDVNIVSEVVAESAEWIEQR